MLRILLLISMLSAMTVPSVAFASYPEELVQGARAVTLWQNPQWQRLLFYHGTKSIVDSPTFFLAATGATDPKSEMEAQIHAFFRPETEYSNPNVHPQCAFPRRFKWLSQALKIDHKKIAIVKCSDREKFMAAVKPVRMSFVFSSYYLNNPASMFGHTLLRVHKSEEDSGDAGLLDHAIGFTAMLSSEPGFLEYAYRGSLGGYPGRFTVTPYYIKIQEYNNHESRDLWEYDLDFSADDIDNLFLTLWEWGNLHADYYYFSENCSYVLMMLLEATRPDLNLLANLHPWVMPVDTLHALRANPGIIKGVRHRPSSWSRFSERMEYLDSAEKNLIPILVNGDGGKAPEALLQNYSTKDKARILDAAIEFIDFQEKLAADLEPQHYADRRRALLVLRASLKHPADILKKIPWERQPDAAHRSNLLAAGAGGVKDDGGYANFIWRPALHDTAGRSTGFAPDAEIRVFDTEIRYLVESKRAALIHFDLFAVRSLAPFSLLHKNFAWQFAGGYRTHASDPLEKGRELYFRAGGGLAFALGNHLRVYGLGNGDIAAGLEPLAGSFAAEWDMGIVAELGPQFHLTFDSTAQHVLVGRRQVATEARLQANFSLDAARELRLRARSFGQGRGEADFSFGYYF